MPSRADLLNGVPAPRLERMFSVRRPEELTDESPGFKDGSEDPSFNATTQRGSAMRKQYAKEWKTLSDTDKVRLRAIRAKRGIKCSMCGQVGYYRENCVNKKW